MYKKIMSPSTSLSSQYRNVPVTDEFHPSNRIAVEADEHHDEEEEEDHLQRVTSPSRSMIRNNESIDDNNNPSPILIHSPDGLYKRQLYLGPEVQSHNYEPDESEVWRSHLAEIHRSENQWWTAAKKSALKRWILTFAIGVAQAIIAMTCNYVTRTLSAHKFESVYEFLEKDQTEQTQSADITDDLMQVPEDGTTSSDTLKPGASLSLAFGVYFLYQVCFTAIASTFVWIEPVCGGSGIPELKCFLNGINVPRVVNFKTLLCRVIGVNFSVAAGLPVGEEGPMVHSGSVVASLISQGQTGFWKTERTFEELSEFRNDREKRDFVACGAAAGVCSAFGSPIGGVLFSLEEASSYFTIALTWRAFFCAMTTLATTFWVRNVDNLWRHTDIDRLFTIGKFNSISGEASNFSIWELSLFTIIGCLGGLIGAIFNAANEHLTLWRMKRINPSKTRRFVEIICISAAVSVISFLLPLMWGKCTELPNNMQDWTNQEKKLVDALVPFRCIPGKEYNEIASLIFTDADTAIKQLLHFREAGANNTKAFSSAALFCFFLIYISLTAITYGTAVPSGLFVPTLLSGAAFGRLIGHLLHQFNQGTFADAGTYSLVGAAAVMGGTTRMTISLTVILLEASGDMQYLLPLMLALMSARFTGNVFNEGLYDIHIKLKKIPFLDPDAPAIAERFEMVAGQAMSTDVKCLRPVERAGVVYELLRHCNHGTFPIVDTTVSLGTLYGTASRHVLCTLLQRRAFGASNSLEDHDGAQQNLGPRRLSPLVPWMTIEKLYPKYPTISEIELNDNDRDCWLDLRPYANTAPYTVNESASIQRTYRLFRTLGLRFLCVVNHNNQVVGVITREDLLAENLAHSLLHGRYANQV